MQTEDAMPARPPPDAASTDARLAGPRPSPGEAAGMRRHDLVGAALIGLAAAALCAPFLHTVYWLGDEGVLLGGAERLLHGGRLYRDFFEFLPPGGFVLTAAWLQAFGISLPSARGLAVLTIAGIAAATYLACRACCRSRLYPALIVLAWVVMTQGYWTEVSHHWFATLFAMLAVAAAMRDAAGGGHGLPRPALAGLSAGMAAMIVPTRGALAMLAGLAAFGDRLGSRRQVTYLLASLAMPAGLLAYTARSGGLAAAFADVIEFPASQYSSLNAAPYGYFANLQNYPLLLVFPAIGVLALTALRRPPTAGDERALPRAAMAFALAGFIGCFPRPDAAHLGFAIPLACPLLVVAARRLVAGALRRWRAAAASLAIIMCLPSVLAYWLIATAAWQAARVPTPRGEVAFMGDVRPVAELIPPIAAAPPGEAFFFYPLMPLLPFLAGREQVSPYDLFTPGYTLPRQYEEACRAVLRQASWVVLDRSWMDAAFLRRIFPGLRDPERDEARRFEAVLEAGFVLVLRAGPFELRRRNQPTDAAPPLLQRAC